MQRCQFHKAGNVLAKVRRKDRKTVAGQMREVMYAGDRLSAKRALERFQGKWRAIYPDAVRCLEKDFDALIAFLEFPEEVGLATHQDVHRWLYQLGLRDLHKSRAAERKRVIECVRQAQAGGDPRLTRLPMRELVRIR